MKHIQLLLLAFLLMPSISSGDSFTSQISISLHYDATIPNLGGRPKVPAVPISVVQSDHIFTFPDYLAGETVELLSGDTIIYTSVIGEDGTVVIPDHIEGVFELVLYVRDKKYSAEVEL